jgi:hypothetical protein
MDVVTVTGPSTQVPGGMRVSSMSDRACACFLDAIVVSMLGIIPLIAVFVTGAVSFNQQALDQWQAGPPQTDAAFECRRRPDGSRVSERTTYQGRKAPHD